jgi:hypothetical protein
MALARVWLLLLLLLENRKRDGIEYRAEAGAAARFSLHGRRRWLQIVTKELNKK